MLTASSLSGKRLTPATSSGNGTNLYSKTPPTLHPSARTRLPNPLSYPSASTATKTAHPSGGRPRRSATAGRSATRTPNSPRRTPTSSCCASGSSTITNGPPSPAIHRHWRRCLTWRILRAWNCFQSGYRWMGEGHRLTFQKRSSSTARIL